MHANTPFPGKVAAFLGTYLIGFGALAIVQGNQEFMFYFVIMLLLAAAVYAIHRRVNFTPPVLWFLAAWGFLHMAGGTIPIPEALTDNANAEPVLYSLRPFALSPRYDQVIHVLGFGAATLASAEALRAATNPANIGLGFAAATALMGMGLGAINEVVEFVATQALPSTNVGGYTNTGWDLVSNAIGAALAAAIAWRRASKPPNAPTH